MTHNYPSLSEVLPIDLTADTHAAPMDDLVERLRVVRRKLARWLPSSDMLALWSTDYGEVFKAAARLESAVKALDSHMKNSSRLADASLDLQMLLCTVEERAQEFEDSVVENVAVGH